MQVSSVPLPVSNSALPQDVVAKAVPTIQATPPMSANPVNPVSKAERGGKARNNEEKDEGGDNIDRETPKSGDKRGGSVNIRV